MKILLTNDDGIYAHGLAELEKALAPLGEIFVVAPDRNRSGSSNSLTLDHPFRVNEIKKNHFAVQGTPTDAVHFAFNELYDTKNIDFVVSGINHGANLGDDVLYSGTVAAAMEAHFLGVKSIAVSLVGKTHFASAGQVVKNLIMHYDQIDIPDNHLLNINVPDLPYEALKKQKVTRLGQRDHNNNLLESNDPRGHKIYWIGPAGKEINGCENTDFYAIERNMISITPILIDLTAHESIENIQDWLDLSNEKNNE